MAHSARIIERLVEGMEIHARTIEDMWRIGERFTYDIAVSKISPKAASALIATVLGPVLDAAGNRFGDDCRDECWDAFCKVLARMQAIQQEWNHDRADWNRMPELS